MLYWQFLINILRNSIFNFSNIPFFEICKIFLQYSNFKLLNLHIFFNFPHFFSNFNFFTVFRIRNESSRFKFIQFSHYLEWISLYDPNHDPKRKHLWLKWAAQGMNHPRTKTVDPRLLSKEPRSEPRGAFTFQRCIYKDEIHFHSF